MKNWGHPGRDKLALCLGDAGVTTLLAAAGWYVYAGTTSTGAQKVLSLLVMLPAFVAAMYVFDQYSLSKLNGLGTLVKAVIAVFGASAFCYVFFHLFRWKNDMYYRSLGLCALVLPAATYIWRRCYFHGSKRFRAQEKLLVVGSVKDAQILSAALDRLHAGFALVGMMRAEASPWETQPTAQALESQSKVAACAAGIGAPGSYAAGTAVAMAREAVGAAVEVAPDGVEHIPDLGPATSENLSQAVAANGVEVIVVRSDALTPELAGVLTHLRFNGIQVLSLLDFCMATCHEIPLEILNEFWLAVADGFDLLQTRLFRRVKRLTDILLASAGLLVALPFMLLVALAIRLNSPGPVLFRQERVGWKGQPFELLKFRSMQTDAERERGPQWAAQDDPRVTTVGRILRKTHFDELPQMINILRGDMSFVGPRPERPEFVGLLNETISFYDLRHYVLPGITGWAQVNYRYGASLDDTKRKLQYDLYYVCKASPLLDLRTLLLTARVVLLQQGSR